jgi:hypothetical protein
LPFNEILTAMPKILMQFFFLDDMHNQYKLAEKQFTEKKGRYAVLLNAM